MKKFVMWLVMLMCVFAFVACEDLTSESPSTPLTPETPSTPSVSEKVEYEITYTKATLDKNSIGTVRVYAIAEITNTGNTDLFLSSGSIDLEDTSGNLVKVLSLVSVYPQIISPGEKAYYYQSSSLSNTSVDTTLSIVLHPEIAKSKTQKINFPLTDIVISDGQYFGVQAVGRVENTSSKDEGLLEIAVIIYDSNNKPFGILTAVEDVKAGVKKGFTATSLSMPEDLTASSVSRFAAVSYPYQFQF